MPYIIFTLLVFGVINHVRSQFQYAFRGRTKRKSGSVSKSMLALNESVVDVKEG